MNHDVTSKRHLLKLAGWTTLAATAALVGCGKKIVSVNTSEI